jgi:hypothetical protein
MTHAILADAAGTICVCETTAPEHQGDRIYVVARAGRRDHDVR